MIADLYHAKVSIKRRLAEIESQQHDWEPNPGTGLAWRCKRCRTYVFRPVNVTKCESAIDRMERETLTEDLRTVERVLAKKTAGF